MGKDHAEIQQQVFLAARRANPWQGPSGCSLGKGVADDDDSEGTSDTGCAQTRPFSSCAVIAAVFSSILLELTSLTHTNSLGQWQGPDSAWVPRAPVAGPSVPAGPSWHTPRMAWPCPVAFGSAVSRFLVLSARKRPPGRWDV